MKFDQKLHIYDNTDRRQSEYAFVTYRPQMRAQAAPKFAFCFRVNNLSLGEKTSAKGLSTAF
jgi:hypothetical protein